MSGAPMHILLVEDNRGDARLLEATLRQVPALNFELSWVESLAEAARRLATGRFDVLLLDLSLPDSQGLDTVRTACAKAPDMPIIVFTGADDEAMGLEAVRLGAQDYVIKGEADGWLLARAIRYATERKRAEAAVRQARDELEERVAQRTAQLQQRAHQLRALAARLARAEELERRRLSQFLHDHLQQLIVAAKVSVGAVRGQMGDPAHREALRQVEELLAQTLSASRSLTAELSPPILYDQGLGAALDWLGQEIQSKHGLEVCVQAEAEAEPAGDEVRTLLFQAVRELLFNVVKHARVKQAQLHMSRTAGDQVEIVVADDGVGFNSDAVWAEAASAGGFGLFGIRERLEPLGGRVEVDSTPGRGTRISLRIPIGPPAAPTTGPDIGP